MTADLGCEAAVEVEMCVSSLFYRIEICLGRRRKRDDEVVGVMGHGVGWLSDGGELIGDRGGVWWCGC